MSPCPDSDGLGHGADVAEASVAMDARAQHFAASEPGQCGGRTGGGRAVTAAVGARDPREGGGGRHHEPDAFRVAQD
jgi:hypothetical protein